MDSITMNRVIEIDDEGVTSWRPSGVERVRWDDLVEIGIVTTDEGPFCEDLFWLLVAADGSGCVVGGEIAGQIGLLAALQRRFPDLDNQKVIEAACSVDDARFVCWRRERGPAQRSML
jgi:hypothetical protein